MAALTPDPQCESNASAQLAVTTRADRQGVLVAQVGTILTSIGSVLGLLAVCRAYQTVNGFHFDRVENIDRVASSLGAVTSDLGEIMRWQSLSMIVVLIGCSLVSLALYVLKCRRSWFRTSVLTLGLLLLLLLALQ